MLLDSLVFVLGQLLDLYGACPLPLVSRHCDNEIWRRDRRIESYRKWMHFQLNHEGTLGQWFYLIYKRKSGFWWDIYDGCLLLICLVGWYSFIGTDPNQSPEKIAEVIKWPQRPIYIIIKALCRDGYFHGNRQDKRIGDFTHFFTVAVSDCMKNLLSNYRKNLP